MERILNSTWLSAFLDKVSVRVVQPLHETLARYGLVEPADVALTERIVGGLLIALAVLLLILVFRPRRSPDFSGGSLSDLVRTPRRLGYAAIAVFLLVIGGWSAAAPLASAAVARGVVSPEGDRKTIQHLEGGIIRTVHVREGDRVAAGDPLVTLDDKNAQALLSELTERLSYLLAAEARLGAELSGRDDFVIPEELFDLAGDRARALTAGQRSLMQSRAATHIARENILNARIDQLTEQNAGLEDVIAAQRRQIDLLSQELENARTLYDRGLERLPRLLALEREQADIEAELAANRARIAQNKQLMGETRIQLLAYRDETLEELNADLVETRRQISEIRGQLPSRADRLERTIVRAPADGTVMNILANTTTGIIRPGEPILELVPEGVELMVDARVRPTDIDRVHAGMRARIILSAYKQRNLPLIHGTVRTVSADSVFDQKTGEAFFLAKIEVDDEVLRDIPEVSLTPGMPVEIMLLDEEQTLAAYLVDPLRRSISRSFLED